MPDIGVFLPVEGRLLEIRPGQGRRVEEENGGLRVPGSPAHVSARVRAYLQTRARDRLTDASDRYAAQLGRCFARITLRDTRSRWGSCTRDGRLMYSWRLIMAPPDVLNYVAAHEVCHLVELNHSPAFWDLVGQLYPGFEVPRRWLKENGPSLHSYRF